MPDGQVLPSDRLEKPGGRLRHREEHYSGGKDHERRGCSVGFIRMRPVEHQEHRFSQRQDAERARTRHYHCQPVGKPCVLAYRLMVAKRVVTGDRRDHADLNRLGEHHGKSDYRIAVEAYEPVHRVGSAFRHSHGLEPSHDDSAVQKVHDGQELGSDYDRYRYEDYLFEDLAPLLHRLVAQFHALVDGAPAQEIDEHHESESKQRSCRRPERGTCGGLRRALGQEEPAKEETHRHPEELLHDLGDGRGLHVLAPLEIAPERRDYRDAQKGRACRHHCEARVRIAYEARYGSSSEKADERCDDTDAHHEPLGDAEHLVGVPVSLHGYVL